MAIRALDGGDGLRSIARQLVQADPLQLLTSADLIREHRGELELLAGVIAWRTKLCEQRENEWNADTRFYWRFEGAARQVSTDIEGLAADLWERGELRDPAPRTRDEAEGHNTGVTLCQELHAYLRDRRRASLRFFKDIASRPGVAALLQEAETVVQRWHEQNRSGERETFDRMNQMRSIDFARDRSRTLADELGLDPDAPTLVLLPGRRKAGGTPRRLHRPIPSSRPST